MSEEKSQTTQNSDFLFETGTSYRRLSNLQTGDEQLPAFTMQDLKTAVEIYGQLPSYAEFNEFLRTTVTDTGDKKI
jgi:hypothetical protein